MQIKRSIEKIPGGMMLVPLFLGALCHTFSPGAGKYFGSFTNGMITGTVPILAVWFFCMGASIKLSAHQRDDYRYGAHSGGVVFLHGGVNKIKRDGNGIA